MGQIKKILSYMTKHFWRLILPVVPSAILFGLFYEQAFSLTFVDKYSVTPIRGLGDVFGLVFSGEWWYYVLLLPVMFIILICSGSYLVSMVYKHFRTGKISIRTPFVNMNHSFGAILFAVFVVFVGMLLYKFIFACIVSFISMIPATTALPGSAEITLTVVFGIITYFPMVYVFMYPILTTSVMLVYGYPVGDAISFALKLHDKPKFYEVEIAYMFPFAICAVVAYLLMALGMPAFVDAIIKIICEIFALSYLVVFSITVVFDLLQIERMDTKKLY